jgi:cellulose synthase/poly-beta-1,6-N-acetylglucosamine synthase-like glycosyltransferase
MLIVLLVFVLVYCFFILKIAYVWNSIKPSASPTNTATENFFSILVPIRNEESNIIKTLSSILDNNYDKESYEIIVINDHSKDNSETIVKDYIIAHSNIRLLNLENEITGKKQAVTYGVSQAKGDIILCTDGDCQVPANWIQGYNEGYNNNKNAKLIFGGVRYYTKSFIEKLLQMELMGLVGIGAVSATLGHPSMINGANFSYKKEAFDVVNGYEGNEYIPSGDDEFLLRKIFKNYPNGISFLKNQNTIVNTKPPQGINELFNQRKRWAGKWKMHKDWFSRLIPITIFTFNLLLLLGIAISILQFHYLILFVLLKPMADLIYMSSVSRFYYTRLNMLTFLALQIVYPMYVVFFGITANFGSFTWKERKY